MSKPLKTKNIVSTRRFSKYLSLFLCFHLLKCYYNLLYIKKKLENRNNNKQKKSTRKKYSIQMKKKIEKYHNKKYIIKNRKKQN